MADRRTACRSGALARLLLKGYDIGRTLGKHALGVETDQGYNGINAAFVLDLLAREDAKQTRLANVESKVALDRFLQARDIRKHLTDALPKLAAQKEYEWLEKEWWFHATLAEAYLGCGDFDNAVAALRRYNAAHTLEQQEPAAQRSPVGN